MKNITVWKMLSLGLHICNVCTFSNYSISGTSFKPCSEIQALLKLEDSSYFSTYPHLHLQTLLRTNQAFLNKVFPMNMTGNYVKSVLTLAHHITKDIINPPIKNILPGFWKKSMFYTLQRDFFSQKTAGCVPIQENSHKHLSYTIITKGVTLGNCLFLL